MNLVNFPLFKFKYQMKEKEVKGVKTISWAKSLFILRKQTISVIIFVTTHENNFPTQVFMSATIFHT